MVNTDTRSRAKKKKVKYELEDDSELLITEVTSDYKSIKTWPLILVFFLLLVVFFKISYYRKVCHIQK